MKYRPEIDGLRAVAVIPVILFHAGFTSFSGGFIGVDIFFVISGYLITSIILNEREADNFTLKNFYLRRARRILPALFLVIIACIPFAWFWLLPEDMKDFSESVVATVGFVSNFFFWLKTGYFDIDAELKPLLHTWSLAVEEQYYWIYPFLFIALFANRGKLRWIVLLAIAAASLWLAQWGAHKMPAAAFFLFPSRFWELIIGALTAFRSVNRQTPVNSGLAQQVLSLLGLSLIIYAISRFNELTPYPSLYTLIPTTGTALIILFADQRTLVGKLLSAQVLVGIGLISYSAYLWHQPLLAFARYRSVTPLGTSTVWLIIICTFMLSYASWRFVEQPFRSRQAVDNRRLLKWMGGIAIALICFGLAGYQSNGFVEMRKIADLPDGYLYHAQIVKKFNTGIDGKLCISNGPNICQVTDFPNADKSILLLGDSHSADLSNQFKEFALQYHFNAWQMSITGCALLQTQIVGSPLCQKARDLILARIKRHEFDEVLIIGNYFFHTLVNPTSSRPVDIDWIIKSIEEMLTSGTTVTFFIPRSNFNYSPMHAAAAGKLDQLDRRRDEQNDQEWLSALIKLTQYKNFHLIDQDEIFANASCGDISCLNGHTADKLPLYRDRSHLTKLGADLLFDAYIKQRLNR